MLSVKELYMKKLLLLTLSLLILALTGCSFSQPVAYVNNETITEAELIKNLKQQYGKKVLDNLIIAKLIEQEAKAKKIKVSNKELKKRYLYLVNSFGSKNELTAFLKQQNLKKQDVLEQIKRQVLTERLIDEIKQPPDELLKKHMSS